MYPGNQHRGKGAVGGDSYRTAPERDSKAEGRAGLLQITPTQGCRGRERPRGRRSSGSFPGAQRGELSESRRRHNSQSDSLKEERKREDEGCERDVDRRCPAKPRRLTGADCGPSAKQNSRGQLRSKDLRQAPGEVVEGLEPEVAGWLAELKHSEVQVKRALSQWVGGRSDEFGRIKNLGVRLQTASESLLLHNLELSSKQEVVSRLWRSLHYPVIEVLRKQLQGNKSKVSQVKGFLARWLSDAMTFYTQLVERIQKANDFQLSQLVCGNTLFQSKTHRRTVMMAVFACQWCYVCLGDVSRYQEQMVEKPSWTKPRAYYLRAQQLAPKDGKPYSRLAIVAINAHRRLDAVYYYMRSLTAKNPFQSAHESLVGLFEETNNKARRQEVAEVKVRARAEKQRLGRGGGSRKNPRNNGQLKGEVAKPESVRKEVWIMPGSKREEGERERKPATVQRTGQARIDRYDKLSSAELTKKLISTFIVAHGKLFTKIGIETVEQTLERLHRLWLALLNREQASLPEPSMLIKMVVINIFSIHHAANAHQGSDVGFRYYFTLGFRLALGFILVLFQCCCSHLTSRQDLHLCGGWKGEQPSLAGGRGGSMEEQFPACNDGATATITSLSPSLLHTLDVLGILLPAIRVWFDWLVHQQALWLQIVPALPRTTMAEFWSTAAEFMNRCSAVFVDDVELKLPGNEHPLLWEDRELAGFMPLHRASQSLGDTFAIRDISQLSTEEHREQSLKRVGLLASRLRTLATERQLAIAYNEETRVFSVRETDCNLLDTTAAVGDSDVGEGGEAEGSDSELESQVSSDDVIVEEEEEEEEPTSEPHIHSSGSASLSDSTDDVTSCGIAKLKAQKDLLTQQIALQQQAEETTQAVLEEAALRGSEVVRIMPKYLVPDTNCFVSMLPSIQALVQSGHFTVAVPLIVLTELEGLGRESEKAAGSKVSTGSGAKTALDYVTDQFSSHNHQLQAITTQGSLLTSLSFRAELTEKASNDDLILESCLNLHSKVASSRPPTAMATEQSYSVVLLTADRNLRVKAHANGLPVKDLPTFMEIFKATSQ